MVRCHKIPVRFYIDDGHNLHFLSTFHHTRFRVSGGVVKIAVYTDGILIPFLFHILRFQVSGVRNDEQRRWHLTPDT